MSITIETILTCDSCGQTFAEGDLRCYNAKRQRSEAKKDGWRRSKGKDVCDKCSYKLKAAQPSGEKEATNE